MNNIDMNFPITVYGNLNKFTDTMSIGRCRIFYKYGNRNSTYITDEFAEELIKTLPYTPVKGIYEDAEGKEKGTGTACSFTVDKGGAKLVLVE